MSQPGRLEERVTELEAEMAAVRFLATKAEKEVSDMQAVFRGHTGLLNAIRDDQVEHGKKLAKVDARMRSEFADVRSEMRDGFTKVDERFDRADDKFAGLQRGQDQIMSLLTKHLGEPDQEPHMGGTDE